MPNSRLVDRAKGPAVNQVKSQQQHTVTQPLQPRPLSQNESQKEINVLIYVCQEDEMPQLKELTKDSRGRTFKSAKNSLSQIRMANKKAHSVSAPVLHKGNWTKRNFTKENAVNSLCGIGHGAKTGLSEGRKMPSNSKMCSAMKKPESRKANQCPTSGPGLTQKGLGKVVNSTMSSQQQTHDRFVNTSMLMSSSPTVPDSVGFHSPLVSSTPLSEKQLMRGRSTADQMSPDSRRHRSSEGKNTTDLQQRRVEPKSVGGRSVSNVSRPQVFTSTATGLTSVSPLTSVHSNSVTAIYSSSNTTQPVMPVLSPPVNASTPISKRPSQNFQTAEDSFTRALTASQTSPVLQLCIEKSVSGTELSQDSGIGTTMAGSVQTPVQLGGGLDSDLGATCSSWANSEDEVMVDFTEDNQSQGSIDENSNSLGDDGEMNKSLTKMYWLNDFALKKKSTTSKNQFAFDPPAKCEQNSHHSRNICICRCTPSETEQDKKPAYKYKQLIEMALLSRPDRTMTCREIRSWFIKNFPFFKRHEKCGFWQNAIRHNLSSNDCFVKNKTKKRHWTLDTSLCVQSEQVAWDSMPFQLSTPLSTESVSVHSVMPNLVMLKSLPQPVMSGSTLTAAQTPFNGSSRRLAFQPILPRPLMPSQVPLLSVRNQHPLYLQHYQPFFLQFPASVESTVATLCPVSSLVSSVPKLALPPQSAVVSSGLAATSGSSKKSFVGKSSKVKLAGQCGNNRGKSARKERGRRSWNHHMIQSGLKQVVPNPSRNLLTMAGSEIETYGPVFLSANCGPVLTDTLTKACSASTGSDSQLVRSSLPPILSKQVQICQPSIPAKELTRSNNSALEHLQQRSKGRRKQNLAISSNRPSDLIISSIDSSDNNQASTSCQAVDTSLNLLGLQAVSSRLSPMTTPPHRGLNMSGGLEESASSLTLDTSTPIGKLKVMMDSLPSPISDGMAEAVNPISVDYSLTDMLDDFLPQDTQSQSSLVCVDIMDSKHHSSFSNSTVSKNENLPQFLTPPSASYRVSEQWSAAKNFEGSSLGPVHVDIGIAHFGRLFGIPDELSLLDHCSLGEMASETCQQKGISAPQGHHSAVRNLFPGSLQCTCPGQSKDEGPTCNQQHTSGFGVDVGQHNSEEARMTDMDTDDRPSLAGAIAHGGQSVCRALHYQRDGSEQCEQHSNSAAQQGSQIDWQNGNISSNQQNICKPADVNGTPHAPLPVTQDLISDKLAMKNSYMHKLCSQIFPQNLSRNLFPQIRPEQAQLTVEGSRCHQSHAVPGNQIHLGQHPQFTHQTEHVQQSLFTQPTQESVQQVWQPSYPQHSQSAHLPQQIELSQKGDQTSLVPVCHHSQPADTVPQHQSSSRSQQIHCTCMTPQIQCFHVAQRFSHCVQKSQTVCHAQQTQTHPIVCLCPNIQPSESNQQTELSPLTQQIQPPQLNHMSQQIQPPQLNHKTQHIQYSPVIDQNLFQQSPFIHQQLQRSVTSPADFNDTVNEQGVPMLQNNKQLSVEVFNSKPVKPVHDSSNRHILLVSCGCGAKQTAGCHGALPERNLTTIKAISDIHSTSVHLSAAQLMQSKCIVMQDCLSDPSKSSSAAQDTRVDRTACSGRIAVDRNGSLSQACTCSLFAVSESEDTAHRNNSVACQIDKGFGGSSQDRSTLKCKQANDLDTSLQMPTFSDLQLSFSESFLPQLNSDGTYLHQKCGHQGLTVSHAGDCHSRHQRSDIDGQNSQSLAYSQQSSKSAGWTLSSDILSIPNGTTFVSSGNRGVLGQSADEQRSFDSQNDPYLSTFFNSLIDTTPEKHSQRQVFEDTFSDMFVDGQY